RVHRAQSDSGKGRTGDDGQDVERPPSAARAAGGQVRAHGARSPPVRRSADCVSSPDLRELEKRIDSLAATPQGEPIADHARAAVSELLDALEAGHVRAASKDSVSGEWRAVPWVKRGILLGFRIGGIVDMSLGNGDAD